MKLPRVILRILLVANFALPVVVVASLWCGWPVRTRQEFLWRLATGEQEDAGALITFPPGWSVRFEANDMKICTADPELPPFLRHERTITDWCQMFDEVKTAAEPLSILDVLASRRRFRSKDGRIDRIAGGTRRGASTEQACDVEITYCVERGRIFVTSVQWTGTGVSVLHLP